MRIPEQTIRDIEQAADIVEVVEDYVSLKKKGQNYWACCPFHDERSPSFSVSANKGIFKCFGCGKAGDSVKFVMEINKIGYIDALKKLAAKYHIEIETQQETPEEVAHNLQRESLYVVMSFAKKFFQSQLWDSPEGIGLGLSYFKERGLTQQTIEHFGLGYSPDRWDGLLKEAEKNGFSIQILKLAGLVLENEQGKIYDRFRGRVMFPIHDVMGRVVAFGARTLKKDDKPKYLNSPETPIYEKSETLYGLFEAKSAVRKAENIYLTEGYLDVISAVQAGVANTVASAGTSLTAQQIKMMRKMAPQATVLYDGDQAGIKAALRGLDLILEGGMDVKVVLFPNGDDPDSFIGKNGPSEFRNYISKNTQDFVFFKMSLQGEQAQNDPLMRAALVQQTAQTIAKIPEPLKREAYIKIASQKFQIREEELYQAVNQELLERFKPKFKPEPQQEGEPNEPSLSDETKAMIPITPLLASEKEFIRILVLYGWVSLGDQGRLADYMFEEARGLEFSSQGFQSIVTTYKSLHSDSEYPSPKDALRIAPQEVRELLADALSDLPTPSQNWMKKHEVFAPQFDEQIDKVLYSTMLHFKFRYTEKLCKELTEIIAHQETHSDVTLLENLMLRLQVLINQRLSIAKLAGIVMG